MAGEATIAVRSQASEFDVELFCGWFCPFAQRAWIALEECGVPYKYVECEMYEGSASTKRPLPLEEKRRRNADWIAVSPRGLVPALRHGAAGVFESLVCVEYVDEVWGASRTLLPGGPADRAKAHQRSTVAPVCPRGLRLPEVRASISYVSDKICPFYYKSLMAQVEAERSTALAALLEAFTAIDAAMAPLEGGPFFLGATFSAFDVVLWPHYQRCTTVLAERRQFAIPPSLTRLHAWADATGVRPSIAATIVDKDRLVANYAGYADGTATSDAAKQYTSDVTRAAAAPGK
mmetsp:Transcript_113218/g.366095  ORF Transcript_113218/g.366095 Transcript_113218/m.366095 type:complete len:291 (-) Transcript_113218:57-929(-)